MSYVQGNTLMVHDKKMIEKNARRIWCRICLPSEREEMPSLVRNSESQSCSKVEEGRNVTAPRFQTATSRRSVDQSLLVANS